MLAIKFNLFNRYCGTDLIRVVEQSPSKLINDGQAPAIANANIFVVHGHNEAAKLSVERTLRLLKLNPIILHLQPNGGNTIIEKFERSSDVGYAVIILTDDDEGRAKGIETLQPRARQNVIFEMGYFIGKLSRKRVAVLHTKGVELPSDLSGIVYIALDDVGSWRLELARELKHAGYAIDANALL